MACVDSNPGPENGYRNITFFLGKSGKRFGLDSVSYSTNVKGRAGYEWSPKDPLPHPLNLGHSTLKIPLFCMKEVCEVVVFKFFSQ